MSYIPNIPFNERLLRDVFNAGEWYRVVNAAEALSMPVDQYIRTLVMYGVEKGLPEVAS